MNYFAMLLDIIMCKRFLKVAVPCFVYPSVAPQSAT